MAERPPLVFLQGIIGDGDLDWQALLGHLTARYTCHLPSLRGRGLSGDHPDLSFGRLVDDVLAYVGWSLGADLAIAATAAQSGAVDAVAPVDPVLPGLWDEPARVAIGDVVARMGELAADDRSTAAAREFARLVFNDEDIAVAEDAGYFEAAGRYVPNLLSLIAQQTKHQGPGPDDPAVLRAISTPVLVLLGSNTEPYATVAARHVVDHVPSARLHEMPGAGHAAPLSHPEALAQALSRFFSPRQQPA